MTHTAKDPILLTGGAGFIGSHTYVALIEAGYRVVILDDFSNSHRDVIDRLSRLTGRPVEYIEGNVLDRQLLNQVFAERRFDAVIHFAARKDVGASTEIPLQYYETNVSGLVNVLQAMSTAGLFRLVFSSSCSIYGEPARLPVAEDAPRSFKSPYGHTKLICEQILEHAAASDPRWQIGMLRYFNPAGCHPSGMIGEKSLGNSRTLMEILARTGTGELPHVPIFGHDYDTHDGTAIRDYIHVCDVADGHVLCLDHLDGGQSPLVLNLGTGQGQSVLDVISAYSRAVGRELPHLFAPRREGDVSATYADVTVARELIGFEAKRSVDEMCESNWSWICNARGIG
ncbi:UDP-glucose 4-epimerase GalE [Tropicimonas sp. TH_r6]|uniref:UDP-glucose 4-epimerase GalE n=1 Tax=Tropicimonas sp. TH_r6 TaxID=3082085 RepID=UPI00295378B2|nr:UDP-glucose 4-epimerase GalE [Tropicimonas sp. TH_r6]MDV7144307.1 UDP-glucose 4-epimerase GalE [Tropicimonas sp. TH_r6]